MSRVREILKEQNVDVYQGGSIYSDLTEYIDQNSKNVLKYLQKIRNLVKTYDSPIDNDDKFIYNLATSEGLKREIMVILISTVFENKESIIKTFKSDICFSTFSDDQLISAILKHYLTIFDRAGPFSDVIIDLFFNNGLRLYDHYSNYVLYYLKK